MVKGSCNCGAVQYEVDHVIDYRQEDLIARVKEITHERGVDLTLNPISGDSVKTDLEALAPLGTVVVFGFLAGPPAGNFADDLAQQRMDRSIPTLCPLLGRAAEDAIQGVEHVVDLRRVTDGHRGSEGLVAPALVALVCVVGSRHGIGSSRGSGPLGDRALSFIVGRRVEPLDDE